MLISHFLGHFNRVTGSSIGHKLAGGSLNCSVEYPSWFLSEEALLFPLGNCKSAAIHFVGPELDLLPLKLVAIAAGEPQIVVINCRPWMGLIQWASRQVARCFLFQFVCCFLCYVRSVA